MQSLSATVHDESLPLLLPGPPRGLCVGRFQAVLLPLLAITASTGLLLSTMRSYVPQLEQFDALPPSSSKTANILAGPASSFCDPHVHHEFGYVSLHESRSHYFYALFESRSKHRATDPLIIYLEGGPGASSLWTMFNHNGPCTIGSDLNSTTYNPYSWTSNANVLWLDQPTGVGFSHGLHQHSHRRDVDIGPLVYGFLLSWLRDHPAYMSRPLFIAGHLFGGYLAPAAAHYILAQEANTSQESTINLSGIIIASGITDAIVQYPSLVDVVAANAYNLTLVQTNQLETFRASAAKLKHLLVACQATSKDSDTACVGAISVWETELLDPILHISHAKMRDLLDMRQTCIPTCPDRGRAETDEFLNLPSVQALLQVNRSFATMRPSILAAFAAVRAKSAIQFVAPLLAQGVRVLAFAGDADLVVPWTGVDAWTRQLEWLGAKAFNDDAASVAPLVVDGKVTGEVRSTAAGLSAVRVDKAGNVVSLDQPAVALALVTRFVHGLRLDQ
ncbi:Aste57867_10957 [Aphanomyces stellatus]|uniref:Aste57867_10957 protein n=1 Tax=Aphanomyces stellatus TaxID=120398 RepID=A0A485KRT7_9STRA|nr:hypothetical protein As57867_010917 [Aphanomyces stellatus]VFT87825.1 Aste57867_10957 [Aphanomyces stellatus]